MIRKLVVGLLVVVYRHDSDQIEPWRTGATLSLPFTPDAIDKATVATLSLEP